MSRRGLGPRLPSGDIAHWLSGGSQTRQTAPRVAAPEELTMPADGAIRLGKDPLGSDVYLARDDRRYGTFVQGSPGSGKTTLLLHAASEDIRTRMAGDPRGVFWLETKGEGVDRFVRVVESAGASHIHIEALGSGGEQQLDLVNWRDPRQAGTLLTAACEYAFGTEAIRGPLACGAERSPGVRRSATQGSLRAARVAPWPPQRHHRRLVAARRRRCGGAPRTGPEGRRGLLPGALRGSCSATCPAPGSARPRARKNCKAPRNKLEALLPARGIFEPDERPPVTFDQLLESHEIVLFNLSPDDGSSGYGSTAAAQLASLIMYCPQRGNQEDLRDLDR